MTPRMRHLERALALALELAFALVFTLHPSESAASEAAGDGATDDDVTVDETTDDATTSRPTAWPGRLLFSHTWGLTAGANFLPSLDLDFYFGALPRRFGRGRRAWSLGYAATLSGGGADRYVEGLVALRHQLRAVYLPGPQDILYASIGGGLACFVGYQPAVIEAEGQVGFLFGGDGRRRRTVGFLGLRARLGWNVRYGELLPMPQIGLFVGLVAR